MIHTKPTDLFSSWVIQFPIIMVPVTVFSFHYQPRNVENTIISEDHVM
jgi:hypothetical protein